MALKVAVLFLAALLGANALPLEEEQDMSIFFEHVDPSARIVGGSPARHSPHMVAVTSGNVSPSLVCGASLVRPNTLCTAAHCVRPIGGNNLIASARARMGSNRWASGGVQHTFRRALMHPAYNHNLIKNDIALMFLTNAATLNANVQLVPLSFDFINAGTRVVTTGWGRTVVGGAGSATLLELEQTVVEGSFCVTEVPRVAALWNVRPPPVDPALEICTFQAAGRGMCHGDSGSALLRISDRRQIGLVSWGVPCARGAPDMFVRISAYRSWLDANIV